MKMRIYKRRSNG